jgi:hypothetical protein
MENHSRSLAFARMPRAEARGGMARGEAKPAGRSWVASAQFRLALPRMPRAEAGVALLAFRMRRGPQLLRANQAGAFTKI